MAVNAEVLHNGQPLIDLGKNVFRGIELIEQVIPAPTAVLETNDYRSDSERVANTLPLRTRGSQQTTRGAQRATSPASSTNTAGAGAAASAVFKKHRVSFSGLPTPLPTISAPKLITAPAPALAAASKNVPRKGWKCSCAFLLDSITPAERDQLRRYGNSVFRSARRWSRQRIGACVIPQHCASFSPFQLYADVPNICNFYDGMH